MKVVQFARRVAIATPLVSRRMTPVRRKPNRMLTLVPVKEITNETEEFPKAVTKFDIRLLDSVMRKPMRMIWK